MSGRLGISDITPNVACGAYPARAVVGERVPISATVFREGHGQVGASVIWRQLGAGAVSSAQPDPDAPWIRMTPGAPGTDRWHATLVPDAMGMWSFTIQAWGDPCGDWRHDVLAKIDAGQGAADLENDLQIGAQLLRAALKGLPSPRPPAADRAALSAAADALADRDRELAARVGPALALGDLLHDHPVRTLLTEAPPLTVWVDRPRALHGAWYEFFPRSTGGVDERGRPVHGTFATAARELPRIAAMGFDVVYLPPIHPIGKVNRKGKNNTLAPEPGDVGSPWAIGSDEGGHDAIHPQLGTFADFDRFVAATADAGMEVALDLALQCAPDHPWAREHPEWFTVLPDGSIAYAENPPKKYQDIYPVNFDNDPDGIRAEVLRVVKLWVEHGVKIFRVDNPHTKPLDFWHWLIWEVKKTDPDVLFLAEAFTRPAMMKALAQVGFTQSYTYFTWRTGKAELIEYATELAAGIDVMRPNFFVNTPDILHASLQHGGPTMFGIRAVLASMLSATWGVYSGFELYENDPVRDGSEEYLNSEKYQLRPRDYALAEHAGRSLAPLLRRLNEIRRAHPALQQMRSLRFHRIDNESMIAFSKTDAKTGDTMLVVCTLDPDDPQEATITIDFEALGLAEHERFAVHDELTEADYEWGTHNYVRLDPWAAPAHIFTVRRRAR
jgi:starch synthase (maltosyl-transferring)